MLALFAAIALAAIAWFVADDRQTSSPRNAALGAGRAGVASRAEHGDRDELTIPTALVLDDVRAPRSVQRVAAAAAHLNVLYPDLAELALVATASGRPVVGAALELNGLGEIHAAQGAPRDAEGALLTDEHGRVHVALRPLSTFRGTLVREAQREGETRIAAEFVATSPQPGTSRTVEVALVPHAAQGWVHLVVSALPERTAIAGANLTLIHSNGGALLDPNVPIHHVTDGAGRVTLFWPEDLALRLEAPGATTCEYRWPKDERRSLIEISSDAKTARATTPLGLELPRNGRAFGNFDAARRFSGRVCCVDLDRRMDRGSAAVAPVRVPVYGLGQWRLDGLPARLPDDPLRIFPGVTRGRINLEFQLQRLDGDGSVEFNYRCALEPGEQREFVDPFATFVSCSAEVRVNGERATQGTSVELVPVGPPGWGAGRLGGFRGRGSAGSVEIQYPDGSINFVELDGTASAQHGGGWLASLRIRCVVDATGQIRFDAPADGIFRISGRPPGRTAPQWYIADSGLMIMKPSTATGAPIIEIGAPSTDTDTWSVANGNWSTATGGRVELEGR